MKKRVWMLLLLISLIVAFSIGCSKEEEIKNESIVYPTSGAYGAVIFNVPETWLDEMKIEYNIPDNYSKGELIFKKDTVVYAGTKQIPLTESAKEVLKDAFDEDYIKAGILDKYDWENYLKEYLETIHPKAKEIILEEKDSTEGLLGLKGIEGKVIVEGKTYYYAFGVGSELYCIWAKDGSAKQSQLWKMLMSLRPADDPENIKGKYATKEFSGEWIDEPKQLLEIMLKDYISMDLPIERTIIGYKINEMESVGLANDIPNILDDSVPYPDQSPWRLLYPSLRVYKVDYELIPYKPDKYSDVAGGGFEMTEAGNKRYPERYAVFADNVYAEHEDLSRLYFLGFIHPSNLVEYGLDASILLMANQWYKESLLTYCESINQTEYVGDAMKVGSLIMSLPLKEKINTEEGAFAEKALSIQTEKEPYGIVVNYWFDLPLYDNTKLSSRIFDEGKNPFPEIDVNPYIKKQLYENMGYIFNGVKNVSRITINVWCLRDEGTENYTKFTFRGERKDFIEVDNES